jgi:hypothetical protein
VEGHKITNVLLILKDCYAIFWYAGKNTMGNFLWFFEGGSTFNSKIVLPCTQDNLGVKKVLAPSKTLEKDY